MHWISSPFPLCTSDSFSKLMMAVRFALFLFHQAPPMSVYNLLRFRRGPRSSELSLSEGLAIKGFCHHHHPSHSYTLWCCAVQSLLVSSRYLIQCSITDLLTEHSDQLLRPPNRDLSCAACLNAYHCVCLWSFCSFPCCFSWHCWPMLDRTSQRFPPQKQDLVGETMASPVPCFSPETSKSLFC